MDKIETPTIETEEVVEEVEVNEDTNSEETVDTDTETEEEDDGIDEVQFLGKQTKLDKEEKKAIYQKGLNYDHIKEKADRAAKLEQELAEIKLKLSEKEMESGESSLKRKLIEDGYDEETVQKMLEPAFRMTREMLEKEKKEAQQVLNLAKRTAEKETLRDKPFFKELEADIDDFISQPMNSSIPLDVAYDLIVGKNFRSGKMADIINNTKKSAIADYQDNAKRTPKVKAQAVPDDDSDLDNILDEESIRMTKALGGNVKEIARYVKEQLSKKKG